MAVREILEIGHPVVAARAQSVDLDAIPGIEVQGWIDDMIDTMRDARGAGIAANQIGIPYRIFTVEVINNPRYPYKPPIPLTVVINPEIEFLSNETFEANEGCLSVPGLRGYVERSQHVKVSYLTETGEAKDIELHGFSATVFQHEFDHLDGKLYIDRITDTRLLAFEKEYERYLLPREEG